MKFNIFYNIIILSLFSLTCNSVKRKIKPDWGHWTNLDHDLVNTLYYNFDDKLNLKYNGAKAIERPILSEEASFSPLENQVIDFTFKNYGNFSAFQLSDITHAPNTPWSEAFGRLNFIPDNLIANHYNELYQKYSAKTG